MLNIEVKAPYHENVKSKYNFKKCIEKVYETIRRFGAENHCMISSFDGDILYELEKLNLVNNTDIKSIYLYNFYEHRELPEPNIYSTRGHGVNISSTKLNREVIQNCHKNRKLVGVWVNAEVFNEDDQFYQTCLDLGVDFICTDYPLKAGKVRNSFE